MPVVNGKSDLFGADVDPARARGEPVVIALTCTNAASDSSGSKYLLCRIPAEAILDARTDIKADTWGFATLSIGTFDDVDALVSAARAASHKPITVNDAKHGLPLWEQLGLAANPGGDIALYAHGTANATGAGSLKAEFHYRYR